ncbi:hypothetical protein [Aliagarivorans marinus]|uniref:hypothetical protein n=1 Tax=Aliagarivorans marinus TaxID=561965 RepID=UPI00041228B6|nr:hypothetical protein [Aliagarivorans marinus]
MTDDIQAADIMTVILRYLQQHPGAEDSLDGITDWWVRRQRFNDSRVDVEHALRQLVGDDVLLMTSRNGVAYYKLNANA